MGKNLDKDELPFKRRISQLNTCPKVGRRKETSSQTQILKKKKTKLAF